MDLQVLRSDHHIFDKKILCPQTQKQKGESVWLTDHKGLSGWQSIDEDKYFKEDEP